MRPRHDSRAFPLLGWAMAALAGCLPQPGTVGDDGRIAGAVLDDRTGAPLGNAYVTLDGRGAAYTDSLGKYGFRGLPEGDFRITVTREGYGADSARVTLGFRDDAARDFRLRAVPANPRLALLPGGLDFGDTATRARLAIVNAGGRELAWRAPAGIAGAAFEPDSGRVGPGDSAALTVILDRNRLFAGDSALALSVRSNGGDSALTLRFQVKPGLALGADTVRIGSDGAGTLKVLKTGAGKLRLRFEAEGAGVDLAGKSADTLADSALEIRFTVEKARLNQAILPGRIRILNPGPTLEAVLLSRPAAEFRPAGMKALPGGSFSMGGEGDSSAPAHAVTLTGFWIDTTEVTQAEYQAAMGADRSVHVDPRAPAENLTWFDAVLYCNARGKRDGLDTAYRYTAVTGTPGSGYTGLAGLAIDTRKRAYRLPTEAEWEFACRGGASGRFPWGGGDPSEHAWFAGNAGAKPQLSARLRPNGFGLYDLPGNVREWVGDWSAPYGTSALTDPAGPAEGVARVLRGGSFASPEAALASARREAADPRDRSDEIGFRVVFRPGDPR